MPLGIVTDDEFEDELKNLPKPLIKDIERGRGSVPEKPESLRNIVGELANEGLPAIEISKTFGISPASISAYKVGSTSTSTYNSPDKKLGAHIDRVRDRITKKASNRLVSALNVIDDESLAKVGVKDASSIAKDMSVIIKNMTPDNGPQQQNNVQFIIHAPKQREEADFDIVIAHE